MSGNVILDKRFCYLSINKVVFAEGNTDFVLKVFMELQTCTLVEIIGLKLTNSWMT